MQYSGDDQLESPPCTLGTIICDVFLLLQDSPCGQKSFQSRICNLVLSHQCCPITSMQQPQILIWGSLWPNLDQGQLWTEGSLEAEHDKPHHPLPDSSPSDRNKEKHHSLTSKQGLITTLSPGPRTTRDPPSHHPRYFPTSVSEHILFQALAKYKNTSSCSNYATEFFSDSIEIGVFKSKSHTQTMEQRVEPISCHLLGF